MRESNLHQQIRRFVVARKDGILPVEEMVSSPFYYITRRRKKKEEDPTCGYPATPNLRLVE